jgi:hypothetical protein
LNQILRRQTSRSHYGSKVPAVTVTVFKYRNKIGKIVVKAVPYRCSFPQTLVVTRLPIILFITIVCTVKQIN